MQCSVHELSKTPAQGSVGKLNLCVIPCYFQRGPLSAFQKTKKDETYAHAELETGGNVQQSIKRIKVDLLISFYC